MIRPAGPDDARAIGELHLRAWWWAYREIVPHDLLAEHDPDSREADWRRMLEEGRSAWVRVEDDQIVGFVALEAPNELAAIYVDPAAQGAGVGAELLAFAEDRLREDGADTAVLWCLRENGMARDFYGSRGWTHEDVEREGGWGPEVQYLKRLGGS